MSQGNAVDSTSIAGRFSCRDVQEKIHEQELEKIGLLQENTNLTDQMRQLMIECRLQEQDLDLSRKSVVRTQGGPKSGCPHFCQ